MKFTRREAAGAITGALGLAQVRAQQPAARRAETHAVWAGASDAGTTPESVRAFVAQLKRANIHALVMNAKDTNGGVCWHSKRFTQAISPRYKDFDMIESLAREGRSQGVEVHLWLCDFIEGQGGAAFHEHQEWAQLSPDGKLTNTEPLFNLDPAVGNSPGWFIELLS